MKLYAGIRHQGTTEPSVEIEAEGPTYEAARDALDAKVPTGWQMTGISRWSCANVLEAPEKPPIL